jgi:hypothetical protein
MAQRVAPRLRTAVGGRATPDRLRRVAAVLVLACLLVAVVSIVSGARRTAAVTDAGGRIADLTAGSAQLYRALADADAMVTSAYVSGGIEPAALRSRYDGDIARASSALVAATGRLGAGDPGPGDPVPAAVATITRELPQYTGLVESARVYNRQGLPLGQSYLTRASTLMTSTILPAAEQLRSAETAALRAAYAEAGSPPVAPLLVVLGALAAIADVSLRELRRTNRVFSPGLVVAAAAMAAALLWWAAAGLVAGLALAGASRHADVADVLDDASTAVLQARSNESLVLVARNGGSGDARYGDITTGLAGLLTTAEGIADAGAHARIDDIRAAARDWEAAHQKVRDLDDAGRFTEAVAVATSASQSAFDHLDAVLLAAASAERAAFAADTGTAAVVTTGLAIVPAVLAGVGAAGAAAGLARRIGEYR